jgi:hypothetical protein
MGPLNGQGVGARWKLLHVGHGRSRGDIVESGVHLQEKVINHGVACVRASIWSKDGLDDSQAVVKASDHKSCRAIECKRRYEYDGL